MICWICERNEARVYFDDMTKGVCSNKCWGQVVVVKGEGDATGHYEKRQMA